MCMIRLCLWSEHHSLAVAQMPTHGADKRARTSTRQMVPEKQRLFVDIAAEVMAD
jgi:hypothetical protein